MFFVLLFNEDSHPSPIGWVAFKCGFAFIGNFNNCSFIFFLPKASSSQFRQHKPLRDHKTDLESAVMGYHFVVGSLHFEGLDIGLPLSH